MKRIMSILNLGFQWIGLMRKQVEEGLESTISKCNNMKQLRAAAEKEPELVFLVLVSKFQCGVKTIPYFFYCLHTSSRIHFKILAFKV